MYELLITFAPIVIIIAIIIWIFDDGGKKQDAKLRAIVKHNYENSVRTEFKNQTLRHLKNSDTRPTTDELDWMCTQLEAADGIERLETLMDELKSEPVSGDKDQLRRDVLALKNRYSEYLDWNRYLDVYKKLNKSQQDYEIDRLKESADPNSTDDNEKIRVLELARRGEYGNTEILVGGLRLFTARKK